MKLFRIVLTTEVFNIYFFYLTVLFPPFLKGKLIVWPSALVESRVPSSPKRPASRPGDFGETKRFLPPLNGSDYSY